MLRKSNILNILYKEKKQHNVYVYKKQRFSLNKNFINFS